MTNMMTHSHGGDAARRLPVGWRRARLGEVCEFLSGGTPPKVDEEFWSGNIPWISPKDMKTDKIVDSINHISMRAIEANTTRKVEAGTILCVTRSGFLHTHFP
jgi:restriction endonuclease S subunit